MKARFTLFFNNLYMGKYTKVTALYFSPTHTTKKVVEQIASSLATILGIGCGSLDITTPQSRKQQITFNSNDIVIFGSPVYIGRLPNLISPYFKTFVGNGATAVAVVVYGNRAYDDALAEARDILASDGFKCIAAAAFVGEHSFSRILGGGRPDVADLALASEYAERIYEKLSGNGAGEEFAVPGNPAGNRKFYNAKNASGSSIDIRKVKPLTDKGLCAGCGYCAAICPMGSINPADCSDVPGICIKCCACVKRCPNGAKYFADADYLSHKQLLEEKFSAIRKEPELYL